MSKVVVIVLMLILISALTYSVFVVYKKTTPKTSTVTIDEKEAIQNARKPQAKEIKSKDCIGYDKIRNEDLWIIGGDSTHTKMVYARFAKTSVDTLKFGNLPRTYIDSLLAGKLIPPDSLIMYIKDVSDYLPRNAGYISGTRCGKYTYFIEYFIDSEVGLEKYLPANELINDPRGTMYWKRRMIEGSFKTLRDAIEDCACTGFLGFEEVTNYIIKQIKEKVPGVKENMTPEEIKKVLIDYTNLYQGPKVLTRT